MTDKITEERLASLRVWAEAEQNECEYDDRPVTAEIFGDVVALITELQSLRSAQAGEVEVVAYFGDYDGRKRIGFDASHGVREPLITLASHQSVIAAKDAEIERLTKERDAAKREARDKDIYYRTWREFYGALLVAPPTHATPLEVRVHRQASVISSMQCRIRNQRAQLRGLQPPDRLARPTWMAGYSVGAHVNKLHNLWQASEARANAAVRFAEEIAMRHHGFNAEGAASFVSEAIEIRLSSLNGAKP